MQEGSVTKVKKIIKIIVDILMYADFLFLMNHGVVRNLHLHGIAGIALFCLFIVHHVLNGWFYKTAFKGSWSGKRILLNVTAWILFVLMILMAVSSVMMSGLVFEWSPVKSTQAARVLHLMSTSWGFMVMSFHLALHVQVPLKRMEQKCSRIPKIIFYGIILLLAAAGIFCFVKTQIYIYMFNCSGWKISAPNLAAGFLEYIGITAGICSFVKFFDLKGNKKA